MSTPEFFSDETRSGASRRTFLTGAGLTGLAAGAAMLPAVDAEAAAAAYTAGRYALELDGVKAGAATTATGGELYGTVFTATSGSDIREKHITNSAYSPVAITCGTGMSAGFYKALRDFSLGVLSPHDGRITRRDDAGHVFHTTEFYDARVTSLQLPAVEVGAKTAAHIAVGFDVQRAKAGTAGVAQAPVKRSTWTTGHFTLTIDKTDRLPAITTKALKVGAMTLKRTVIPPQYYQDDPTYGPLEVSDLVVAFAGNNPADLWGWFRDFIIDGNRTAGNERTGKLTYRGTDNTPLFAFTFTGVGIYRLSPATSIVGTEKVVRTNAGIYCESAAFSVGRGVTL